MGERTTRALSLLCSVFWHYTCICILLRRGLLGIASFVCCVLHRYLPFFFHDCVSSLSCLAAWYCRMLSPVHGVMTSELHNIRIKG